MASALTGLGEVDQAIALFQQSLSRVVNKPGVHVMLGHALKARGELDDAIRSYRSAFEQKPDYSDAYWSLANTKTYRFSDAELERMRGLESGASVSEDDRIHLSFALGKALEDRGEYEESFAAYQRGNQARSARNGYDPARTSAVVERQIETCTASLFDERGGQGCGKPDPIFVVGLPRAGSTLIEQILASHSSVDGTMELHEIPGLAQRLNGRGSSESAKYPAILRDIDGSYFARFGQKYIDDTAAYRWDAPLFVDKMPNNFLHVGLIRLILPNAKVIDARRHPMACGFSCYRQLFGEGQDFSYGLESIGSYYRDYVRLMEHWDEVLSGFVLRVQHEDVIEDLETQVRRILDFCGLPFEDSCLDFHKTERSIKTPSSEQVRQPIYRSGMDQWRNYENWLNPLKESLGEGIRRDYAIY